MDINGDMQEVRILMKSVFEEIIAKLEEYKSSVPVNRLLDDIIKDKPKELGQLMACNKAIEIVKQESEKYTSTEHINSSSDSSTCGWISCSERLPEPYASILVCENNGEIHLCRYHNKIHRYFYDGSDWDIKESEVIAWKPLPEPYQQKGE